MQIGTIVKLKRKHEVLSLSKRLYLKEKQTNKRNYMSLSAYTMGKSLNSQLRMYALGRQGCQDFALYGQVFRPL